MAAKILCMGLTVDRLSSSHGSQKVVIMPYIPPMALHSISQRYRGSIVSTTATVTNWGPSHMVNDFVITNYLLKRVPVQMRQDRTRNMELLPTA